MPATATPARDPLLALAALVLVIWHILLAADYVNAKFLLVEGQPELTAHLLLPQLWATVGWGMAVWLGLLGALFLIWRDDASVLLLFAAGLAAAVAVAGDVLAGGESALLGLPRVALWVLVIAVPALGWLFARSRKAAGVLN